MSIYDLSRALGRYKWTVLASFFVLFAIVGAMTFKLVDGKPTWRASAKYDSSVQIAVIPPGIDSLTTASVRSGEMSDAAVLYRGLLGTDEAALFIAEAAGYRLDEAVRATVDSDAALITASVYGPTPEKAQAAALSTFDYLEQKLQIPLRIADLPEPSEPIIVLDGPFESTMIHTVDGTHSVLPTDLFLIVDSGLDDPTTLPIASRAGQSVGSRTTLSPVMALTLTLQNNDQGVLDVVRVAPPAPQSRVARVPELELELRSGAIVATGADPDDPDEEELPWELDASRITVTWQEPTSVLVDVPVPGQDVQIALLTPEPGWLAVGGRRGPIVLVAALIVGTVLILSGVIVTDAWRREQERRIAIDGDQQALIVTDAWLEEPDTAIAQEAEAVPLPATTAGALGDGNPWSYEVASAANRANQSAKPDDTSEDDPEAERPWQQLG